MSSSTSERDNQARLGFTRFTSKDKEGDLKPDMIALVDAQGNLVAMNDVPSVVAKQWKKEGDKPGDTIIPALNVVLGNRVIISDIWGDQNRMMKIGVAPVIDPDARGARHRSRRYRDHRRRRWSRTRRPRSRRTARQAAARHRDLRTPTGRLRRRDQLHQERDRSEDGHRARASQPHRHRCSRARSQPEQAASRRSRIDGVDYYAAAVTHAAPVLEPADRMPKDYPGGHRDSAMVLSPVSDTANTAGTIKLVHHHARRGRARDLDGRGCILSHRRLIAQVDQVELGITDIINGNVDRTSSPGRLSSSTASSQRPQRHARAAARPASSPAKRSSIDEVGTRSSPAASSSRRAEEGAKPQTDPDLARLAQESEPDYYKRVFTEYVAQRGSRSARWMMSRSRTSSRSSRSTRGKPGRRSTSAAPCGSASSRRTTRSPLKPVPDLRLENRKPENRELSWNREPGVRNRRRGPQ